VRAFLSVLILLAAASPASGATRVTAFMDGNELLQTCRDREPACLPYVIGVADALEMVSRRLTNICRPDGVTPEQLLDVLISWLEDNPAERHRPAAKLAGMAYAGAWPCNQ
jgi:hypothetical protein